MKTIVVHQTITKIKEKYKLQIVDQELPEESTEWNYDFSAKHLEETLQSLPENCRTVFILIEIEGYKHKEVSKTLNISIGTSKSQLSYAKNYYVND